MVLGGVFRFQVAIFHPPSQEGSSGFSVTQFMRIQMALEVVKEPSLANPMFQH
jgi:hypothetical protein